MKYKTKNRNLYITLMKKSTQDSIFPVIRRVAAQTIGQDLVTVQPLTAPNLGISKEEMERIELETRQKNRDSKIDSLVEGSEYNEIKVEDHPDYKSGSGLYYIDYTYSDSMGSVKSL